MATVSRWRLRSIAVINRVLESTRGQELWQIRKAISEAYQFGERLRCRWYKHRPSICQDYKVGAESCLQARSGEIFIVSKKRSQKLRREHAKS